MRPAASAPDNMLSRVQRLPFLQRLQRCPAQVPAGRSLLHYKAALLLPVRWLLR